MSRILSPSNSLTFRQNWSNVDRYFGRYFFLCRASLWPPSCARWYIRYLIHSYERVKPKYFRFLSCRYFCSVEAQLQRLGLWSWRYFNQWQPSTDCQLLSDIESKLSSKDVSVIQKMCTNIVCAKHVLIILYCDQQMHDYLKNYHTPTCFDTIVPSSDRL
jgi:hypothetical protein